MDPEQTVAPQYTRNPCSVERLSNRGNKFVGNIKHILSMFCQVVCESFDNVRICNQQGREMVIVQCGGKWDMCKNPVTVRKEEVILKPLSSSEDPS